MMFQLFNVRFMEKITIKNILKASILGNTSYIKTGMAKVNSREGF